MRPFAWIATLSVLALAACGGGGHSPTEPAGRPARGNWIGTISGTHAALGVRGTCDFEMNLDPTFSGRWWIDCPGASSEGQVVGLRFGDANILFAFVSTRPLLDCPWDGFAGLAEPTMDGDFEVFDCDSDATLSTGTFELRRR